MTPLVKYLFSTGASESGLSPKIGLLGTIHKGRPQNFRIFGPPPPLVRNLDWSIRLNPRNLPYYVCFWTNPPPPLFADVLYVCSLIMDGPWTHHSRAASCLRPTLTVLSLSSFSNSIFLRSNSALCVDITIWSNMSRKQCSKSNLN